MRFYLFIAIVVAIVVAGFRYIAWRLMMPYEKGSPERRRIRWLLPILPVTIVGAFVARRADLVVGDAADALAWCGYVALGFSSLLFTLVVIRDVILLSARATSWVAAKFRSQQRDTDDADLERRRVLLSSLNIGKVGASGLMLGYGALEARDLPAVRRVEVPIVDLPQALVGFRIVQITDLHIGPTIKEGFVAAIVDVINQLDADMVAITGDVIDGTPERLANDVAPLGKLQSKHGTFVATGNHEYYSGVDRWVAKFDSMGMKVLLNRHEVIDVDGAKLLVAGVTDIRDGERVAGHVHSVADALEGAPDVDAKLMLAHQPRSIFDTARAGFDLQISGHTHGGQFFPWNFVAHLGQPYVSGLHRHDATWIYVSRGTGYWGPPVRLGAPSEITLITLSSLSS